MGDAIRGGEGEGDEDIETAIVLGDGGEVEAAGAVSRPRVETVIMTHTAATTTTRTLLLITSQHWHQSISTTRTLSKHQIH